MVLRGRIEQADDMNQTTVPPPPPPDPGPRVTREAMRDISTLRRARDDRMVGGVAEGLSRHFDVDPIIIRVLFGALTLFGGTGLCVYLILWMTVPEEGKHDSGISSLLRRDPGRVMVAGVSVAAVVGALTLLTTIGWSSPNPFPIVTIGVVVLVLIAILSRRGERPPPSPPPPPGTAPYAGPSAYPFSTPPPPTSTAPATQTAPVADAATDVTTESATEQTTEQATATPVEPATESTVASTTEPPAWWQRPRTTDGAAVPPGGSSHGPYTPVPPPPPPPPKPPRSHLFALTMATIAIALGVVWLLDDAVVDDMPASVYPGVALGVISVALLISTWFGRSRLLIFVGLLAAFATAVTTIVGSGPIGERTYRPSSTIELRDSYEFGTGAMDLDLSYLADPENLSGQTVRVEQRIGELQVIVPSSISVEIDAEVEFGDISGPPDALIDDTDTGEAVTVSSAPDGTVPDLRLDVDLKFGEIQIVRVECPEPSTPQRPEFLLPTDLSRGVTDVPACH